MQTNVSVGTWYISILFVWKYSHLPFHTIRDIRYGENGCGVVWSSMRGIPGRIPPIVRFGSVFTYTVHLTPTNTTSVPVILSGWEPDGQMALQYYCERLFYIALNMATASIVSKSSRQSAEAPRTDSRSFTETADCLYGLVTRRNQLKLQRTKITQSWKVGHTYPELLINNARYWLLVLYAKYQSLSPTIAYSHI